MVHKRCLDVGRICVDGVGMVRGWCVDGVWMVYGSCLDGAEAVSGSGAILCG